MSASRLKYILVLTHRFQVGTNITSATELGHGIDSAYANLKLLVFKGSNTEQKKQLEAWTGAG